MVGALSLALLFGSPWIVGIVWMWRRLPRDRAVPPSMGEHLRRRIGIP